MWKNPAGSSSQYARSHHSAKAVRYGAGSFEVGHLRIERPADSKSIFGHRSLRRLWTEHGAAYRIKNGKKYIYLHCVTNHNGLGCSSHLISESKLAEVVLAALQGKVQRISGLEHRLDEINEIPKNERRLKSVEEHLKMLEQEEQKYQTLRRQLYEDMSSGIVSKEEYKEFSHSFNEKVEAIRKAKAEMNRQRDCLNNLDVEHLPWIEDFKSYQNLTSLNRRVLVELVESITVYDKEHIHIQYRFDQEIRNVLEYCSSVPAEETEESIV